MWYTKFNAINTFVCDGTFCHIKQGLHMVKSTPINNSLKKVHIKCISKSHVHAYQFLRDLHMLKNFTFFYMHTYIWLLYNWHHNLCIPIACGYSEHLYLCSNKSACLLVSIYAEPLLYITKCALAVGDWMYLKSTCNTFTPQIKGSFCSLNVIYHNLSSPGVLQLPWCGTFCLTIKIAFSIDYSINL